MPQVGAATARKQALTGLSIALKHQVVDAPSTWATLQPELRKDDSLVPLVNLLSVSFRDPEAVRRAFTVMRDDKQLTTDGPFAETKEQLLGLYLIDVVNLDEALTFARELGTANPGGAYELRPLLLYNANTPIAEAI